MRATRIVVLIAHAASLVMFADVVHAGGRAIVTVNDVPEYAVVGVPESFTFVIRDITGNPMDGLMPEVVATYHGESVRVLAEATRNAGEYSANVPFSKPGSWSIRFNAFDDSSRWERSTLRELTVIAPRSPAPAPLSQARTGERLFAAKGCNHCHIRSEQRLIIARAERVEAEFLARFGPDLFERDRNDARLYVVDMPDLGLTPSEIEALTAFINAESGGLCVCD